jgi:hypothetical protein
VLTHHLHALDAEQAKAEALAAHTGLGDGALVEFSAGAGQVADRRKRDAALAAASKAKVASTSGVARIGVAFLRDVQTQDGLSKLSRYETAIERRLLRTIHELHRIRLAAAGAAVPPPLAVDVTVGSSS